MKKILLILALIVIFIGFAGLVFERNKTGNDRAAQFLTDHKWAEFIDYQSIQFGLLSNSVIINHAYFPAYAASAHVDQLSLDTVDANHIRLHVSGMECPVLEFFIQKYPHEISLKEVIQTYMPYAGLVQEPALTFLLIGQNNIKLDGVLDMVRVEEEVRLSLDFKAQNLFTGRLEMTFLNAPPSFIMDFARRALSNQLAGRDFESVQNIKLSLTDKGFKSRYLAYIQTLPPRLVQQAKAENPKLFEYVQKPEPVDIPVPLFIQMIEDILGTGS